MYYNRRCCDCSRFNNVLEDDNCLIEKREYSCCPDQQIIKHQHVVNYRHDIINEYDVIHEHEYNYYDVVTNREVVHRNDYTTYNPKYCGRDHKNDEVTPINTEEKKDCAC